MLKHKQIADWTKQDYNQFIYRNYLHQVWTEYCNPPEGLRCVAWIPNYPSQVEIGMHIRKVEHSNKEREICDGKLVLPYRGEGAAYEYICEKCGFKSYRLYRWKTANPEDGKMIFLTDKDVLRVSPLARCYYATLGVFRENIIDYKSLYSPENMTGYTLGIDLDVNDGFFLNHKNKIDVSRAIFIIREELETFVPSSYNLQTSGNGIYFLLHHRLLNKDIEVALMKWQVVLADMKNKVERVYKCKNVNVNPFINDWARVFKMVGSLHQEYSTVCIPLPYDVNLMGYDLSHMKTELFKVTYIREPTGVGFANSFYKRLDMNDKSGLQMRLNEIALEDIEKLREQFKMRSEGISNMMYPLKMAENVKYKKNTIGYKIFGG